MTDTAWNEDRPKRSALRGDQLQTYLNDHLAGATAGLDLARHLAEQESAAELRQPLLQIADEIESERGLLREVIGVLDFRENELKKALGWATEKVALLKFARTPERVDVARLLELEALCVGIYGKRSLWQTLDTLQRTEPRLGGFDFALLRTKADQQLARLEAFRRRAAA